MASILSERISALRKERGLTQEQLGNMVGVSYQAVGKWEKGGAPDVELLPALSRQLGVTIDALFGMDGVEQVNVEDAVDRWLMGFSKNERMNKFCRLVWSSMKHFVPDGVNMPEMGYLETCKAAGGEQLILTQSLGGGGILLDIHAEDLSFVTLWPKPEGGYARWLAPKSEYRRLFAILAKPGCLELLEYMYSRKISYFSPNAASKHLKMPPEALEELLQALEEQKMVCSMDIELDGDEVTVYKAVEPLKLIPFLLLARGLMQWDSNYLCLGGAVPLLGPEETWEDKKENI